MKRRKAIILSSVTLAMLAIQASAPVLADPPVGYYDSVNPADAATLRATLHEVIDDHTRFPYTAAATDTWDILEAAQEDPNNAGNILDVYANQSIAKFGGGVGPYNREHTWPKSYGFPNDVVSNYPFTDCHHLFLSNSDYNTDRGNLPYRTCNAGCTERTTEMNNGAGGGSGAYPGNSNWLTGAFASGTWETWIGRRGDVARAQFYMDVRYEGGVHGVTGAAEPDLVLTDNPSLIAASQTGSNESIAFMGDLAVLVQWHLDDPVDDFERVRNDVVFGFQGNRNPFVDHPEWVDCLFAGGCEAGGVAGSVWINELHYDNAGADADEGVEVAGPADRALTGWSLVGYNGSSNFTYHTVTLAGSFANQQSGFGTLWFEFAGMQNGSPDAVALVDNEGSVVSFMSYEGTMTAANGPAAGLTSTDIGVSESNATRVGFSLQLSGTGNSPADFVWAAASTNTRGAVNSAQEFVPLAENAVPAVSMWGMVTAMLLLFAAATLLHRRPRPRATP